MQIVCLGTSCNIRQGEGGRPAQHWFRIARPTPESLTITLAVLFSPAVVVILALAAVVILSLAVVVILALAVVEILAG